MKTQTICEELWCGETFSKSNRISPSQLIALACRPGENLTGCKMCTLRVIVQEFALEFALVMLNWQCFQRKWCMSSEFSVCCQHLFHSLPACPFVKNTSCGWIEAYRLTTANPATPRPTRAPPCFTSERPSPRIMFDPDVFWFLFLMSEKIHYPFLISEGLMR